MIGESSAMQEVYRLIDRAGPSEKAILIQGESGTGKELVAQALHDNSPRAEMPLVIINCAALPETLLESELFGHEKGSFTGAINAKPGLFEVADGGTLFIDEIGELPGILQAKLLRTLEDGSLRRIGSIKERRVNVRLLAATNRNLVDEVQKGHFREDLFYRLNVFPITLPPLREREGDVKLLFDHFVDSDWDVEPEVEEMVIAYSWPGNVRQLINAIERAKIMADDHVIRVCDLPPEVRENPILKKEPGVVLDSDDLLTIERSKVVDVLKRVDGNKARAARVLGIDRRKVYRLIEKHGIQETEITTE
jgi:transcriptional regulator with PAS, ATPase and Fis domain